jgi:hypothetical protein
MDNNFGVSVIVSKEGKVEHIQPEDGWEGQLNWEVITYLGKGGCTQPHCPYAPDPHRHQHGATARIFLSAH